MPKHEPGPWAATIIFAVLLALSLVFASCAEAQIATPPPDTVREDWRPKWVRGKTPIKPTRMHRAIYEMMEACSGMEGQFADIRWSIARSIEPVLSAADSAAIAEGGEAERRRRSRLSVALWSTSQGPREIILMREYAFSGFHIAHESLHDLYDGEAPMDVALRCLPFWWNLKPTNAP